MKGMKREPLNAEHRTNKSNKYKTFKFVKQMLNNVLLMPDSLLFFLFKVRS